MIKLLGCKKYRVFSAVVWSPYEGVAFPLLTTTLIIFLAME